MDLKETQKETPNETLSKLKQTLNETQETLNEPEMTFQPKNPE